MKIFLAAEQLLHNPKEEFAAGRFRVAMEVPERATSVLAAIEATAVGPVAAPVSDKWRNHAEFQQVRMPDMLQAVTETIESRII
jgi:hypothetical protein